VVQDETVDVLKFGTDDEEPVIKVPEPGAVEEAEAVVIETETADELELALILGLATKVFAIGGFLYIWRRLPAPQYSVVLPGQTMLQSAWSATGTLPVFRLDPQ
jgi:hypothetical protein